MPFTGEGVSMYWVPMVGGAERGSSSLSAFIRLVNSLLAEDVAVLSFLTLGCFDLSRESPLWGKFGI